MRENNVIAFTKTIIERERERERQTETETEREIHVNISTLQHGVILIRIDTKYSTAYSVGGKYCY